MLSLNSTSGTKQRKQLRGIDKNLLKIRTRLLTSEALVKKD